MVIPTAHLLRRDPILIQCVAVRHISRLISFDILLNAVRERVRRLLAHLGHLGARAGDLSGALLRYVVKCGSLILLRRAVHLVVASISAEDVLHACRRHRHPQAITAGLLLIFDREEGSQTCQVR